MTREEVKDEILNITEESNNILVELPTGYGKTRIALEVLRKYKNKSLTKVLIVVPINSLKEEWKKEIVKWKANEYNIQYVFSTYISFPKQDKHWDFIIFDEGHHISNRCIDSLKNIKSTRNIILSATVGRRQKEALTSSFKNLYLYKVETKQAIDDGVLPDPIVYLIPMSLKVGAPTEILVKNPKGLEPAINTCWATRWNFIKQKKYKVLINCTEQQYYSDISAMIDWYKRKAMYNKAMESKWLRACGDRLKWLSDKKTFFVKEILLYLKNYRTLTFCNSISQTEELGKYCINSKNADSMYYKDLFNNKKIKHITACNMLNEGANLTNCQIGIYANLNSSETIIKQRLGRILRHKKPIIIIPYYKNTRDEEIIKHMIQDYNPELIKIINNIKEIKL